MKNDIIHHVPDEMLQAYAVGEMSYAFSLVVAAHLSMCDECRARLLAFEATGGTLIDTGQHGAVARETRDKVFGGLDAREEVIETNNRLGVFPGPVAQALKGQEPAWRRMGMGSRQCVLHRNENESVRLLYIPAGQAVPDHGHNGLELTLVLQGAFADEFGTFAAGDLEVGDESFDHTPIAQEGEDCICLAATDASLRFNAFLPRLLQPVFGI